MILNIVRIPFQIYNVIRDLYVQKSFIKNNITAILEHYQKHNDGSLSPKDFRKINKYYGLAVPAILGEAFCSLTSQKMKLNERWALTSQGVVTGLFDDFFDDASIADDVIEAMLNNPDSYKTTNTGEELIIDFYIRRKNEF